MKPSLAEIPLLADADPAVLAAMDEQTEWFSAPAGWPILEAGEPPDGVWFLLSGSVAAFKPDERGAAKLLGYIRRGEPIGEMALIAREPHRSSVFAMRDSEVLKLSPDAFDMLAQAHPDLMRRIAKLMLTRARADARSPRAEPKVYALISTSPTIDINLRARTLQAGLKRLGARVAIITEADEAALSSEGMNSAWFDALEERNDAVFLVSPIADTQWFRTCLRQADRIWFFARADARPSLPLLPPEEPSPARQFRLIDVVLLHHGMDRKAATTDEWRIACDAARLFHWRGLEDADGARLARVIAGRSIGLVLSGGGARAYAHIGVVRALREAGLPFDTVGGTSMGAIIAACVAMGWDDDEIERRIRKAFVESNPLGDYVLPVVGLVRGRRVEDRLAEHFGDTLIEDLGAPFFLRVHRSRRRRCARASRRPAAPRAARHDLAAGHPSACAGGQSQPAGGRRGGEKFPCRHHEGYASRPHRGRGRGRARGHRPRRFPRSARLHGLGCRAWVSIGAADRLAFDARGHHGDRPAARPAGRGPADHPQHGRYRSARLEAL